ncbi:MAG: glycosyltransferase, partial [Candidatus Heimdallarchaeota archaeon]|nr:glycosyltransferase [Candidatus Heimdallarchaeota archaeon]
NLDIFYPVDKDTARKKINWNKNKKYILFPGNPLDTCKRYDIAQDIVNRISNKETQPVILFPLTNIPHNEVPLYMCGSDVMLLVSDYEASPMVVKEAVACGLPCVCYDVGDASAVLKDVPRSYIIPPDKNKAANLVRHVLSESFHVRQNFLSEKYSTKYSAGIIYSVYQNLIEG